MNKERSTHITVHMTKEQWKMLKALVILLNKISKKYPKHNYSSVVRDALTHYDEWLRVKQATREQTKSEFLAEKKEIE